MTVLIILSTFGLIAIIAAVGGLIWRASQSREQERLDSPEAGRKRAKQ